MQIFRNFGQNADHYIHREPHTLQSLQLRYMALGTLRVLGRKMKTKDRIPDLNQAIMLSTLEANALPQIRALSSVGRIIVSLRKQGCQYCKILISALEKLKIYEKSRVKAPFLLQNFIFLQPFCRFNRKVQKKSETCARRYIAMYFCGKLWKVCGKLWAYLWKYCGLFWEKLKQTLINITIPKSLRPLKKTLKVGFLESQPFLPKDFP